MEDKNMSDLQRRMNLQTSSKVEDTNLKGKMLNLDKNILSNGAFSRNSRMVMQAISKNKLKIKSNLKSNNARMNLLEESSSSEDELKLKDPVTVESPTRDRKKTTDGSDVLISSSNPRSANFRPPQVTSMAPTLNLKQPDITPLPPAPQSSSSSVASPSTLCQQFKDLSRNHTSSSPSPSSSANRRSSGPIRNSAPPRYSPMGRRPPASSDRQPRGGRGGRGGGGYRRPSSGGGWGGRVDTGLGQTWVPCDDIFSTITGANPLNRAVNSPRVYGRISPPNPGNKTVTVRNSGGNVKRRRIPNKMHHNACPLCLQPIESSLMEAHLKYCGLSTAEMKAIYRSEKASTATSTTAVSTPANTTSAVCQSISGYRLGGDFEGVIDISDSPNNTPLVIDLDDHDDEGAGGGGGGGRVGGRRGSALNTGDSISVNASSPILIDDGIDDGVEVKSEDFSRDTAADVGDMRDNPVPIDNDHVCPICFQEILPERYIEHCGECMDYQS